MLKLKICIKCLEEKEETTEFFQWRNDTSNFRNMCIICDKKYHKNLYQNKKEEINGQSKDYYLNNKEQRKEYGKKYRKEHKEEINKWHKQIREKDPIYALRADCSRMALSGLQRTNGSKRGQSFYDKVSYTPQQLMDYLMNHPEKESWMTPNNRGRYSVETRDDTDASTWTWQIDHIIPHSKFNYNSMEDEDFKKCWALANLRPLNSKQNMLDGSSRIRHKK